MKAAPAWNMVIEITADFSGSTLRATIDCSALTICDPIKTLSTGWCGGAAMAALADDLDLEFVAKRPASDPGVVAKWPSGDAGHVVQAIDLLDAPARHQAVVDHGLAAGAAFLGRLEDHHRRAVEIAGLGEIFRRAQQHGGVAVMAAGVHQAGRLGGVGHADVSSIGSASMSARSPITLSDARLAAADHADDAGAADAGDDLIAAELAQPVGDDAGGAMDFVQKFRMLMEIMPPGGHVVGEGGNAVDDGHWGILVALTLGRTRV